VLSQFPKPRGRRLRAFTEVLLPARTPISIIAEHGAPYYIKIDVEHYDAAIPANLFSYGIRPPYISAESHPAKVFSLLLMEGGYKAFKLIEGTHVHRSANDIIIQSGEGGLERFHSSATPPGHLARTLAWNGSLPKTTNNYWLFAAWDGAMCTPPTSATRGRKSH